MIGIILKKEKRTQKKKKKKKKNSLIQNVQNTVKRNEFEAELWRESWEKVFK